MYAAKYEPTKNEIPRGFSKFRRGDRVMTYNSKKGTVVRLEKDEYGEYFVVKLDAFSGEYAYEASNLVKIVN